MLRVVLSVRAGRLLPSAILRRLATYSRKNRLYFAFRELSRVIRADFLLRYFGSVELRRAIGTATNKSELFNRYAQWVAFGSSGQLHELHPPPSAPNAKSVLPPEFYSGAIGQPGYFTEGFCLRRLQDAPSSAL